MKPQLYAAFAQTGKALSSPARLEILDLLAQGEKPVELIAEQTRLTVKNASAHLRELRNARLVETRKQGTYVFYRLASDEVFDLLRALQRLAEARNAEVERIARAYLHERDTMEPIRAEALRDRIARGDVTVIDVRPADEYLEGHVPEAISIPVDELDRWLAALPSDHEIIAYCRGPYCVYATEAVLALRTAGFKARRMEEGVPDWRALGLPVETGSTFHPSEQKEDR